MKNKLQTNANEVVKNNTKYQTLTKRNQMNFATKLT